MIDDLKTEEEKTSQEDDELETDAKTEQLEVHSGNKRDLKRYIIKSVILGLALVLGTSLLSLSVWYKNAYSMPFKDLLYIITGPIEGTGSGTVNSIIGAIIPYASIALGVFVIGAAAFYNRKGIARNFKIICSVICSLSLPFSLVVTVYSFGIDEYFRSRAPSGLYEDWYIDPNSVNISASGEKRNLIYVYVESLETSHMTVENGGYLTEDYLPNLTALAKENISFSHLEEGKIGGFRETSGTGWTIAALLASTSGIPYSFPISGNSMNNRENFAPGLTNLGDILEQNGYTQEFLCGSDAGFAGRDKFFTQHGNYKIFDLFTAREEGYIPEDYSVWWGYEDKYLFQIAKDEATRLASGGEPFNLTVLTVDLHSEGGYICDLCENEFPEVTANVLRCTDKLVSDFVKWCQEQPFYENTTIIVTGDHRRHDKAMIKELPEENRTIYNCFINSAVEPSASTFNRTWTTVDMFPTILAAMGFEIEGNRLGLGTNMFSGLKTLCEIKGFDQFSEEMGMASDFYLMHFYYTVEEWLELQKEKAES